MSASRRYEILLPLRFNDGEPVPDVLIGDTLAELENQFGAVSWESQIIRGRWRHEEQIYFDDLTKLVIDVEDTVEHRRFFRELKERSLACRSHRRNIVPAQAATAVVLPSRCRRR